MFFRENSLLTASEALKLKREGRLSTQELIQHYLGVIEQQEPKVHALAVKNAEQVWAQVEALERLGNVESLALAGIPIAVKDNIDVEAWPTAYGANAVFTEYPEQDASCIAALRAAGAIIIGKSTTAEYAFNHPPSTRNPVNVAHTPGGSSSGSAAGVAAGMFPLAIGTQTGGSTIRPAAYCGVYGYKPTFNLIPRAGVKPFSENFDTVGWFAHSIEDIRLLLNVFKPFAYESAAQTSLQNVRIGVCYTPFWSEVELPMQQAVGDLAQKLGAELVQLPAIMHTVSDDHRLIMSVDIRRALHKEYSERRQYLSPALQAFIEWGAEHSSTQERQAHNRLLAARLAMDELLEKYDVLITPAALGAAPASVANTGSSLLNRMWSAVHVPCLSLPLYKDSAGMPLGIQLIGRRYGDVALLDQATALVQQIKI